MSVEEKGYRLEHDIPGMVKDVLAQKGGTATLPCKVRNTGAGIVSFQLYTMYNFYQNFNMDK